MDRLKKKKSETGIESGNIFSNSSVHVDKCECLVFVIPNENIRKLSKLYTLTNVILLEVHG